ncbi:hypothetical protein N7533_012148 [Penicillium manginii]|uniref:uncharacterized protein n=1 Tax=Penicillium manginii TaxID=203109 RepID=UPI002546EACC|nr:uncharacterized protein N7533_012148 [Penicillium manginii]KAJ5739364.1 hypothetical protein N7533_012148 [Penicillium manginii]
MHSDTAHFDAEMGTDDMVVDDLDFSHTATSNPLEGDSLPLSLSLSSSGPRTEPESCIDRCIGVDPRPKEVCSSPSPLLLQPLQVSGGEVESGAVFREEDPLSLQDSFRDSRCWSGLVESPGVVPKLVLLPQLSVSVEPTPISGNINIYPEQGTNFSQLDTIPEELVYENEDIGGKETTSNSAPLSTHQVTSDSSTTEYSAERNAWIGLPAEPNLTIESSSVSTPPRSEFQPIPSYEPAPALQLGLVPNEVDTEDPGYASSAASTNSENNSVFDEDYHSDTSSHTASLLSDVKDYCYENGRRYHSYREGHYVLPNDEPEQDRQDLLHHVRNLVLNGALFRAPVSKNMQRVLDIGTGTGIWAIDFADSYPGTEVVGTDLSPIQPSWVPPNLRFIVDDAESPLAIQHKPTLRLHPRARSERRNRRLAASDDDEELRLAPTLREFLGQLHAASEAFHRPMNIAEGHRQRLIEAGFEDVRDEVYKVPSSAWHDDPIQKQIGRYNLCSLLMAVESYSLALFTRVLGWSNHQTQVFLAGVRRDLRNPEVHTYCNLHIVYGRKPWIP